MDVFGTLPVRFHFNGEFIKSGSDLQYCGGYVAMAYIDRDKVSLPELVGHLKDHCVVLDGTLLHWLVPGKELKSGLRAIVDDNTCIEMANSTEECCVADVFVEAPATQDKFESGSEEDSDYEAELGCDTGSEEEGSMEEEAVPEDVDMGAGSAAVKRSITESREKIDKQIQFVKEFYSPSKGKAKVCDSGPMIGDKSSSDSEYLPGDSCTSGEDDEAKEILRNFKVFKKKVRSGRAAELDDVFVDGPKTQVGDCSVIEDDGHATPYADSSDDENESFDDEGERRASQYQRFSKKDAVPKFALGMKFNGKKQFKKAIIKYGLAERKVIKFVKDEGDRVRVKCDWPTCSWHCLLSTHSNTNSWQIATLKNEHTCPPRRDNRLVTARRIAEKYEKMIMANPTWRLDSMKSTVQEEMFADVTIPKLKRAKGMVMQKLFDATKGQYQRLFDYQLELLRSNPGSTVIVQLTDEVSCIFNRMYICLDACKRGFVNGCRRVVGLDGCFFKGSTTGELLCAVGRDANNYMYPLAWAVVEKENNDTWDWFCDILFRDIHVGSGDGWVFISDQQKGILNAVEKWAPNAEHRNCARHIYANWKKKFKKKEWQKKWWRCAKAPCPMLFNLARAKLAQATREGAQAVLNTDPSHWSRAWFKIGSNCDSVDNNLCESFNKWIVEARFFPIITMLETIRRKVMVRIQENSTKVERWGTMICPNILKKVNAYITQSGFCHAVCNGAECFEVVHWDHRFTVNLLEKTCSCRYWQLSGLPCPHAISCIYFRTNSLEEYIASCYSVSEFKKTYSHYLQPLEGMHSWPISDRRKPIAPSYVRMPGRPKKERRRDSTEKPKSTRMCKLGTVIRCRTCKGVGHNRATCSKRNGPPSASGPAASGAAAASGPSAKLIMSSTKYSSSSAAGGTSKRKRSKAPSKSKV